ncbi:hypothetical protein [Natrinema amylolyticum]|uniref:hypothetical protein n=1 Tax=Natrinema amylolyticum TaxID=2878679 RepID=UPI001CFC3D36|nr:hypothetical protein [Natrinema amylolyticum]
MKVSFEITEKQATAVVVLAVIVFVIGAAVGAAERQEKLQSDGWVSPDDWSCMILHGDPDGDSIIKLFNDSMSFHKCATSDDHRIVSNAAFGLETGDS